MYCGMQKTETDSMWAMKGRVVCLLLGCRDLDLIYPNVSFLLSQEPRA